MTVYDHFRLLYFKFTFKELKKLRSGTFLTSHRPTWSRSSPISQSLRGECPRIGCVGGLAPIPKPI